MGPKSRWYPQGEGVSRDQLNFCEKVYKIRAESTEAGHDLMDHVLNLPLLRARLWPDWYTFLFLFS